MKLFRKNQPFVPRLTFSPAVLQCLRDAYTQAETILEYGSGGSTDLAASLGKRVFSVESDRVWAQSMRDYLNAAYPSAEVTTHYVDIGRTKSWGRPVNGKRMADYHHYPLAIWDSAGFVVPDVILIDGRFRVACLCAAILKIDRPTRVLFDDYSNRPDYAVVEAYVKPSAIVENMAVFDLVPTSVPKDHLTWMIGSFVQPR
jgi:protein O-GlcNAc transferase